MIQLHALSFKPRISILILVYNQSDFIESALASVVAQCSAAYELEVIIIDDGSTDSTVDKVIHFRERSSIPVKLLLKDHLGISGIAANLIEMINLSNGDYIAFLAGDDKYSPNRFHEQLELFGSDPSLQLIYADGVNCIDGNFAAGCHSDDVKKILLSGDAGAAYDYVTSRVPTIFIQGVLAKSSFLKQVLPFDIDLIGDDWVFNIKVFDYLKKSGGGFYFIPSILFVRNIHERSTSRNVDEHYRRVVQVVDRYGKDPRKIKSVFIAGLLASSINGRNYTGVKYLLFKMLSYPEALLFFTLWVVKYPVRKLKSFRQRFS
jgi:glycosyltransferase involved in cell wall biosynthesis